MNENSDWLDGMLYYAGWGIVIGAITGSLLVGVIFFTGIFVSLLGLLLCVVLPGGVLGGIAGGILGLPLGIVHKLLFQMRRKAKYKTPIFVIATIYVFILSCSGSMLMYEDSVGRYSLYGRLSTVISPLTGVVAAIAATSFFVYSVRKQLKGESESPLLPPQ